MFSKQKCNIICSINKNRVEDNVQYSQIVSSIIKSNQVVDNDMVRISDYTKKLPKLEIRINSNESKIRLIKNPFGFLIIEIFVNSESRKVLVDTGAEITSFTKDTISGHKDYVVDGERVTVKTAINGQTEMEISHIDEILLGQIKIKNLPVLVVDDNMLSFKILNHRVIGVDGIIGWDVLSKLDFEIDYPNRVFKILQNPIFSADRNLIASKFPTLIVSDIAGNLNVWGLDTGARKSWINEKVIEKINPNEIKCFKKARVRTISGREKIMLCILSSYVVLLGKNTITFKNIKTGFTGFMDNFEFDGVFGQDILKKNRLSVINSKGTIEVL